MPAWLEVLRPRDCRDAWRDEDHTPETAWGGLRTLAAEPLRGAIRRYAGWWEQSDDPVSRWETAGGGMSLVLSFGPTMRVASASHSQPSTVSSFIVGMYDEPALTEHDGVGFGAQIDLTPAGAYALVGGPMDELANRAVPIEEVCGRFNVDQLIDRLLATSDAAVRVSILDHELSAAIARGPRLSPEIAWVDWQLPQRPGVQIGALAAELDWSRGRLVDGFRREVGIPPKTLARVLRFGGARDELTAHTTRPSFAELAVRRGYADQSHFNREFREFSGQTPTEFLAELGAP